MSVKGHSAMSATDSSRSDASTGRHSDLRFAGIVSAAMIATVLVLGALAAPLLSGNGSAAPGAHDRSQTIRLATPAPGTVAPAPAAFDAAKPPPPATPPPGPGAPAPAASPADRPRLAVPAAVRGAAGHGAPGLQIRTTVVRRAPGVSPLLSRGLSGSETRPQAKGPEFQAPLASSSDDTDGDGLPDLWERDYGLDPDNATDATLDSDGDGLDNRMELRLRTAPTSADSDGNGIADGNEDTDLDGLRNRVEIQAASDPAQADSNGDGVGDAQDDPDGDGATNLAEQQAGTDPGPGSEVPPVIDDGSDPIPAVPPGDADVPGDGGEGGDASAPPAPAHPAQPAPAASADPPPGPRGEQAAQAPAPRPAPAAPPTHAPP